MRKTVVLLLLLVLGCGGGGGGSAPAVTGWTGPVNQWSYPDVSGNYVLQTSEFRAVCTDGSSGSVAPVVLDANIQQTADLLTFYDLDASGKPIIDSQRRMQGSIDTMGNFRAQRDIVTSLPGVSGQVSVKYRLDGSFTADGWSGTYVMTAYSGSLGGGCTCTASFTGDRI